jgi:hypothetical protein
VLVANAGFVVVGIVLALATLPAFTGADGYPKDPVAASLMLMFGAILVGVCLSLVTARATADSTGFRYRYGLISRACTPSQFASLSVVPGSGSGYRRVCLVLTTHDGNPVRLTAIQRADTATGRADLATAAERMTAALHAISA